MTRLSERLFFALMAVVVLCWGGYHFYRYYNEPLQFETAFEYTVPRTITGVGIAIRDEMIIDESPRGVESYLLDDAARVAIGQPVAEYYPDDVGDRNIRRLREIEQQIKMLEEAQDTNVNNLSNTDNINRDIRDRLGIVANIMATGQSRNLSVARADLTSLMNRRQIAIGNFDNYQALISALKDEYSMLSTSEAGSVYEAKSPGVGFFSKQYDGYETLISPAEIDSTTITEYLELIENPVPQTGQGRVGRLVKNQVWYFAMPIKLHESEWLKQNQTVELGFEQLGRRIKAKVYDVKFENKNDTMIAIFQTNQMTAELINLRVTEVSVYSTQYSGVRVSSSALYFRENERGENERGVYILSENTVKFKLVYPVYEEQSFLLSDPNPDLKEKQESMAGAATSSELSAISEATEIEVTPYTPPPPLKQYDLVIIKGTDLYDGKPIQ